GASCAIEGVRMLNLVLKVSGDAVDKAPAMFTQLRAEDTQCMQQLEAFQDRLADARKGYSDTLKVMARFAAVPILAVLALVAVLMRGALANVRWSALVFGLGGA
ncbi:uncharacterized protein HaLaN_08034, partial [Haematococcus lacustris]